MAAGVPAAVPARRGRHRRKAALTVLATAGLLGVPALLAAGAAPAAASPALPRPAAGAVKSPPVRPPLPPGAVPGNAVPAKPNLPGRAQPRPLTAWTVTLTASSTWLWPTQYSTLTATANMDVGPTPYWIRIYDNNAAQYVASCPRTATCSVPVTQQTPATHSYTAWVSDSSPSYPPGNVQATTFPGLTWVTWHGVALSLSASQTTPPVRGASVLTATAGEDVGPSPFYTEIYDITAHTRVAACGAGVTCSATVSQDAAATHGYVAYVAPYSVTYPPPAPVQATSATWYVTWSDSGWRIDLTASGSIYGPQTVTANTSADVGPTPYYIEIFDETGAGTLLARCAVGTSCSRTFTPSYLGTNVVAFVSMYDSTPPPAGTRASSNVVTLYERSIP